MSESKLDIWLLIKTDMYADNSQNKEVNSKKKIPRPLITQSHRHGWT